MTRSTFEFHATAQDRHVARLAAIAIALSAAEAAFPSPLPGIKPGIANIVVLLVMYQYGWRSAAWISLLRVVAGSILFGSFLSPGFVLSFAGACASLGVLAATQRLPRTWFGPVSHSILAALAHTAAQLAVAYLWLVPHPGILYFAPLLGAAAVIFGLVNGLICAKLLAPDTPSLASAKAA